MSHRFTSYFSDTEWERVERIAKDNMTSCNVVVRSAVCDLIHMPRPMLHVTYDTDQDATVVTRNNARV